MRPSKTIKQAKARADKYFAGYIRLRDKDKPCITCGRYGQKDCGHFISRRFEATRYDERNSHGQCITCNRFQYGNQFEHGVAIDRCHGEGTAKYLLQKSKMTCKRTRFDYDYLAWKFFDKIKNGKTNRLFIDDRISEGMAKEMELAKKMNIPIINLVK